MTGGEQLSGLVRVRNLQADRARAQLMQAKALEAAARAHDAATQMHSEQAAMSRAGVLADLARQTGALRDIFHFAALAEDHEGLLDTEAAACAAAANAVRDQASAVQKQALATRQALRAQQKTTELLTITRSADARRARQALARREDDNARNDSSV